MDETAIKYDTLTYLDVIQQGLQVMDSTASTLCMDNDIPLIVSQLRSRVTLNVLYKARKSEQLLGGMYNG